MASVVYYPGLDETGWNNAPEAVADKLFTDWLLSEESQTFAFYGDVSSYPGILQRHRNDPSALSSEVEVSLTKLFSRYFSNIKVDVSEIPNTANPAKAQIGITLFYTDTENIVRNLSAAFDKGDSMVNNFLNNYNGEAM